MPYRKVIIRGPPRPRNPCDTIDTMPRAFVLLVVGSLWAVMMAALVTRDAMIGVAKVTLPQKRRRA